MSSISVRRSLRHSMRREYRGECLVPRRKAGSVPGWGGCVCGGLLSNHRPCVCFLSRSSELEFTAYRLLYSLYSNAPGDAALVQQVGKGCCVCLCLLWWWCGYVELHLYRLIGNHMFCVSLKPHWLAPPPLHPMRRLSTRRIGRTPPCSMRWKCAGPSRRTITTGSSSSTTLRPPTAATCWTF